MSYERLTKKRNDGTYYIKKCDETYCDGHCSCCDFGFDEEIKDRLGELEDKIESRQAVILPTGAIDVLKLLTCASICYQHIFENMVERMAKSEQIGELFMKSPMPQGTTLRTALYELMQSEIDCNKITGIDDVLNAMPSFKKYLEESEEKLRELRGEKE